jgi:hypothetical protein
MDAVKNFFKFRMNLAANLNRVLYWPILHRDIDGRLRSVLPEPSGSHFVSMLSLDVVTCQTALGECGLVALFERVITLAAPMQRSEAIERRDRGEALGSIALTYNVHPSTISWLTA